MHYQRVGRTCSSGQRVRAAPADVMAEAPHAYETSADYEYYVYIYGHYTVYVRVLMTNTVADRRTVRILRRYAILLVTVLRS